MGNNVNYNHCIMETVETEEIVCLQFESSASNSHVAQAVQNSELVKKAHSYKDFLMLLGVGEITILKNSRFLMELTSKNKRCLLFRNH